MTSALVAATDTARKTNARESTWNWHVDQRHVGASLLDFATFFLHQGQVFDRLILDLSAAKCNLDRVCFWVEDQIKSTKNNTLASSYVATCNANVQLFICGVHIFTDLFGVIVSNSSARKPQIETTLLKLGYNTERPLNPNRRQATAKIIRSPYHANV